MPASSPTRPLRHKRESSTIARSAGKALADVMNKDKAPTGTGNATESDAASNAPSGPITRRTAATIRESSRGSRPSLDLPRASVAGGTDKSTPKLVKRPPTAPSSFPSKPTTRQDNSVSNESPSKPSEKPSKPRTSLTLRGLSSALQSKSSRPPSALPKYNPKHPADIKPSLPRSGARKRVNDCDGEKDEEKDDEAKSSEDDADDDFVTVERPISPLPRRATRNPILPVSLSLTSSTPPKKGNVLHKPSSSISSPNRPLKASKVSSVSITPVSRLQNNQASVSRPSSSASAHSQRTTPMTSPSRKPTSVSRAGTMSSLHSVRRRPTLTDDSTPGASRLDASPRNPFQLPETSGSSLLSPPLSPFLEGVSLDSIDAGDVSAFLSTVVSPTKPSAPAGREPPPQTPSRTEQILPDDLTSPPPQTPISQSSLRPPSILTTDPRQSMLSLRQYLENSGDLEHLLSQPLPAVLTPDARERLLSFGFSPGFAPPPFPRGSHRPEPQTPTPDGTSFTSISQVLFPPAGGDAQKPPGSGREDSSLVEVLRMQLVSAEAQRAERDARIERLEGQLFFSREAREQEAAELSTQVSDLEEQLRELLEAREQEKESERRMEHLEALLRDKDHEWEQHVAALVAQVQEQCLADQERIVDAERHKGCVRAAAAAWEQARTTALNELELVRSNKAFIEVTLLGLDASMQQLRQSL